MPHNHPAIGTVVKYVDQTGGHHDAIVTAVWGPDLGVNAINLVYASNDESKADSYGRQIERDSSVSAQGPHTAHGRYYTVPE